MARYTTAQIIKQFQERHGDKFDYSLVNYVHVTKKVLIICRTHGKFEQLPAAHRRGQGCAQCMYDGKRLSRSNIIQQFRETHGDLYDYSLVQYSNVDAKIKIICKEHDIFDQTPFHHRQGSGCPKCIGRDKAQEEILEQFEKVHGDKYNYSLLIFEKMNKKVKIACHEHGVFEQEPSKHVAGQGCPKCAGTAKLNNEEVIAQFIATHGDRYGYSSVDYVSNNTKIKIICREHGEFEQIASSHKQGVGCPICAGNYQLTNEQAIGQFTAVHGDLYDYSEVKYIGVFDKVKIICPEHGFFEQTPKSHKAGSGCPDCAITIEHTRSSYIDVCSRHGGKSNLYLIKCNSDDEYFYKVGIAAKGANARFNTKQKLPYKFEIIKEIGGEAGYIWDLEKQVHKLLKKHRYLPKLSFSGSTECFSHIPKNVLNLLNEINSKQLQLIA